MTRNAIKSTIIVAMLSACSLMDVQHRHDPNQDFSLFKSYAWLSDDPSVAGRFPAGDDTDNIIRSQIMKHLDAQGFIKKTVETADFLVNYQAILGRKTEKEYQTQWMDFNQLYRATNIKYSSSTQTRMETSVSYESGRLIVDIIDSKDRALVWRGILETPVGVHKDEEKQIARLKTAVDKVIQAFPPSK